MPDGIDFVVDQGQPGVETPSNSDEVHGSDVGDELTVRVWPPADSETRGWGSCLPSAGGLPGGLTLPGDEEEQKAAAHVFDLQSHARISPGRRGLRSTRFGIRR